MTNYELRTNDERIRFCDEYFDAVGATCVRQAQDYREYALPREVDKELTDRPYYWLWVEQTGQVVSPTIVRLAFTPTALSRENDRLRDEALAARENQELSDLDRMFFRPPTAELVTLGSFRLERIMSSVVTRGRFACVTMSAASGRLVPWLMVNALVSYRCDSVEQSWHSIGVCLENRQVVEGFFNSIQHLPLQSVAAAPLLASVRVDERTALKDAQTRLQQLASQRPKSWADFAWTRLEQEQRQLETYYSSLLPGLTTDEQTAVTTELGAKLRQLQERMAPRVEVEIRQLALVGLVAH